MNIIQMIPSMAVLVTGGAGYIGTHMVKKLLNAGHWPIVIDNLSTGHRDLIPGGVFVEGDIGDADLVDALFKSYSIDAVMHFAAYSELDESMKDPIKYYQNNVAATTTLLKAMVRNKVKRMVFSSSAAVYGDPIFTPITEVHPCRPVSPFGETKLFVEKILKKADLAHGLKSVSLRYFNAAGADPSGHIGELHQPETHLIPSVLETGLGKRSFINIFGTDFPTPDGTCVRDYVHVNDLCEAHLLALNHLVEGGTSETYNIGNTKGYSVRQVVRTAQEVMQMPVEVVESEARAGDPASLVADATKIRKELGWRPEYEELTKIIQTAWNWGCKNNAGSCAEMVEPISTLYSA